jgi:glycosyltransferase involved in cell wall biosynthesis
MKILRVIASMNPTTGGPCQGIRNSIPELKKLGVHNEVVCLDNPDASFLSKDVFPIHALGSGKGPWNYNRKLLPWLAENLAQFDVVIVHGLWLYHSYAVKKAISCYKRTQVIHKQGTKKVPKFYIMPHGMLDPYFQQASGRKLKALRNWIFWKLIECRVVNEADGVLFTCEAELQLARESFKPYHPKREINVGYGIIEPPPFTSAMQEAFLEKCPELKGHPYILFLSRIHEKKGVDILIKAYSEIILKILKERAELVVASTLNNGTQDCDILDSKWPMLVVAGPGLETSFGESMHHLTTRFKELNTSVIFPGMLTGDAKWGAFYGCEAFVLPSHQENFGIAVVEALACCKPVLISNQVNIWREIEITGSGFVANDTLEGIINLLESWQMLSLEDKREMNTKARASYERLFAIKPHVIRFVESIS